MVVTPDSPVLPGPLLDQAIEVDVDAVSDGEQVVIGAIMEHIEQAGALQEILLACCRSMKLIGCADQGDRTSG